MADIATKQNVKRLRVPFYFNVLPHIISYTLPSESLS